MHCLRDFLIKRVNSTVRAPAIKEIAACDRFDEYEQDALKNNSAVRLASEPESEFPPRLRTPQFSKEGVPPNASFIFQPLAAHGASRSHSGGAGLWPSGPGQGWWSSPHAE